MKNIMELFLQWLRMYDIKGAELARRQMLEKALKEWLENYEKETTP